jgi:hypothetical protein
VLLARLQPVEVVERVEPADVAVRLAAVQELLGRTGEEQPVERGLPGAPRDVELGRVLLGQLGLAPSSPLRKPMTESGMSKACGFSSNSTGSAPFATSCRARSPTTLELGVTLVGRPRMRFAAAYISSICSKRSPRPSATAC